jgi:ZIP family zinc transporter
LTGNLLDGTLAFATAALLYLIVEELLIEAHQREYRATTPAYFFAGFLLLDVLQYALGN